MCEKEGEIILTERYGSSGQEVFYVKPTGQESIVAVETKKTYSIVTWFMSLFLPQGYPDSVSPDYLNYQLWDTAQAFCSTITGTLATQEVLRGVGVGDTNASPIAATVTWILKDGCGHLGRIYFAWSHGTYLDAYSKKWRLYADCLNDAAICMEMALPFFKGHTTTMLCLTTVMKAIVGVAGGATRAALTQHHAVRFNMADVAAKDSAQETAVNLIASMVALLIITALGNSLLIFSVMVILHIVFNYFAVRSVCLRTFNEPRFLQTINRYLKREIVSTPCEINRHEPIIFYQIGKSVLDLRLCGFQIKLGHSVRQLLHEDISYEKLKTLKHIYAQNKYLICSNSSRRRMYVILYENAATEDILRSYFHAVVLSIVICSINHYPLSVYETESKASPFSRVCRTLQEADWSRECSELSSKPLPTEQQAFGASFLRKPSQTLLSYVNSMVQKEWLQLRVGLRQTGWNLDKHLLIADEWRIESDSTTKHIPDLSLDKLT